GPAGGSRPGAARWQGAGPDGGAGEQRAGGAGVAGRGSRGQGSSPAEDGSVVAEGHGWEEVDVGGEEEDGVFEIDAGRQEDNGEEVRADKEKGTPPQPLGLIAHGLLRAGGVLHTRRFCGCPALVLAGGCSRSPAPAGCRRAHPCRPSGTTARGWRGSRGAA